VRFLWHCCLGMFICSASMSHTTNQFSWNPPPLHGENCCIIVAGGSGSRCGTEMPKQFCQLGGKPVLLYSMQFFAALPEIDKIVVVVSDAYISEVRTFASSLALDLPIEVVCGGTRRQDSVLAGLQAAAGSTRVLIHDGARPFPPPDIPQALASMKPETGLVYAMPATDSIKRVGDDNIILETVPRQQLWAMQTPQIFPAAKLADALTECNRRGLEVSDDASAFEIMGWPVQVFPGTRTNIKITYAEDFILAEAILKARKQTDQENSHNA